MSLKRIALIFIPCSFVLLGVTAYLKLCVFGWEEKFIAHGSVRINVQTQQDVERLSGVEEVFSTPSTAHVEMRFAAIHPKRKDLNSEAYRVKMSLTGHGVAARGYLRLNPIEVVYEGESEDEEVIEKVVEFVLKQGVRGQIEIVEIKTPIAVVTE